MGLFRNEPEIKPAVSAAFSAPRPLTAAASRVKIGDKGEADAFRKRRTSSASVWQSEAWEYYDAIGEIKYSFQLVSSVISRIRLYAAVVEDVSETPVALDTSTTVDGELAAAAERALARLDSAYGGQAGLLRDASLNLSVAGECYLVQVPERIGSGLPETWDIRSVDELQVDKNGNYYIVPRRDLLNNGNSSSAASNTITLPPGSFVGRVWRAHPRFSEEPDSSMRPLLDLCSELLLLNRTFRATARSRLNAGALYLPDGLSVAAVPDMDGYDEEGEPTGPTPEEAEDDFEEQLLDAMTTPIKDEDSAAAVVPLIIRGPADLGDKIKQFKFERSFDEALVNRADRVLERILQGIDVPKDIVTGLANVKYTNAQQIDDNLYKSHIEPMILLISDALTQIYLRPYLRSLGYDEPSVQRIVVWYDPSSVATRSDRAADADSGFEKMAISAETWRRTHGFSDADAPTSVEWAMRFLSQHGMMSPELTEALLTAISPEIMNAARAASQAASPAPIPGQVQNILDGGTGAPTDPNAPAADGSTPPADGSDPNAQPDANADPNAAPTDDTGNPEDQTIPPDSDNPAEAGEDAPPFQ